MAKKVAKVDNIIDPAIRKQFLEMRDHWEGLDDRANTAAGKRRQYQAEIKKAGFKMSQIKTSLLVATPEGEAEIRSRIADDLLAAAYSGSDLGDQLSLFLDVVRTPLVDRAFKEGEASAMRNEAAVPKYDPDTEAYRAFMEGYHAEQARQVSAGIKKLDSKKMKATTKPAKGAGKTRGRPKKAAEPDLLETAEKPAERTLIKAADKAAKAAKTAHAADAGPPRRPSAQPVTRATLAASKAAAKDEAESYFSRSAETKGSA